ncbi:MAG: hypothetical protein VYD19_11510, partial [Myxococcota bacterium]|nr:hypothetical protein [Myxococcota bacterium]
MDFEGDVYGYQITAFDALGLPRPLIDGIPETLSFDFQNDTTGITNFTGYIGLGTFDTSVFTEVLLVALDIEGNQSAPIRVPLLELPVLEENAPCLVGGYTGECAPGTRCEVPDADPEDPEASEDLSAEGICQLANAPTISEISGVRGEDFFLVELTATDLDGDIRAVEAIFSNELVEPLNEEPVELTIFEVDVDPADENTLRIVAGYEIASFPSAALA